ncbi:tryptophan synthase subunit alpha [Ferviditalea candida]|uniref:Tryptophan synthase alpha chain n=1 Tax=Ferviditalea candida TaxID=3108399 RepID=A0ABU5ZMR7_9BACL|nr:tryptophan synthase subunit alpha [Paenibacillaceae bacterium T2]
MNRIDEVFADLRKRQATALIPFVTVGDPDLSTSLDIIEQLELAGADLIELGVPYSDPLADGPVIQRASQRALSGGRVTIVDSIRSAKAARKRNIKLPFILFTYYNPVLQLGLERFFEMLQENDISGIIIPDLPVEEDGAMRALSEKFNIHLIPLVAPTSKERIQKISARAAGFIYCVSSLGVTGVRSQFAANVEEFIETVKQASSLPVAVGFGISSHEHFQYFSALCDGVIVGSAIVRKIEDTLPLLSKPETKAEGLSQIREFVAQIKGNPHQISR